MKFYNNSVYKHAFFESDLFLLQIVASQVDPNQFLLKYFHSNHVNLYISTHSLCLILFNL
jgi:hypothetical protein